MLHVDQQVQLKAEPLQNLGHASLVIGVFLAAAGGLRQALLLFLLGPRTALTTCVKGRGVSRRVLAQVGHRFAQPLDHLIKNLVQQRHLGLASQAIQEP